MQSGIVISPTDTTMQSVATLDRRPWPAPSKSARSGCPEAGRDPDRFDLIAFSVKHNRETIEQVAEHGASQAPFMVPCDSPAQVEETLESLAAPMADGR
jgi:hypothetical protein